MAGDSRLVPDQTNEIEELRARLQEAEETLHAIRSGEVDALVVADTEGREQVYTLKGEEHTYRVLIESINEGAVILTLDGTLMYANQKFAQMSDTPLERVMGSHIRELVVDEDAQALEAILESRETTRGGELRLKNHAIPEGVPIYLSLSPLSVDGTQAISAIVTDLTEGKAAEEVLRQYQEGLEEQVQTRTAELRLAKEDLEVVNEELAATNEELRLATEEQKTANRRLSSEVAERKQAEEALRESREDLNRAQAVAKAGSWRLDTRRNELLWSDETYRMFGVTKGTPMTYEAFLTAIHPDDRDNVDQEWSAAIRGEPYDIEHRIIVDRDVKWVHERAELEFDEQGQLLGGFGTVQDITDSKRAEEELAEHTRNREFLADSATRLLEPMSDAELFEYAGGQLRAIIGNGIVAVNEYDPSANHTIVRALRGPDNKVQKLVAMMGGNVVGLRFTFDEHIWQRMIHGTLVPVEGGLYDLTFRQLPLPLCQQIESELDLGPIYAMPLVIDNELMGTVAVLTDRAEGLKNQSVVQSLVNQITTTLKRRRAEEALRISEARFRALFEQSPLSIQILSPDGWTLEVNRAWEILWGVMGSTYDLKEWNILQDKQLEAMGIMPYIQKGFAGETTETPVVLYDPAEIGQPGQSRSLKAFIYPIKDETGRIIQVALAHMDVTELKETEEALGKLNVELEQRVAQRTAELEATNKELEAFSYSVSHDLRAPLRRIDGFSQALLRRQADKLDEEGKDYLRRVRNAAQQTARLIDDILGLSRATRAEMHCVPVDLSVMTQGIIREFQQANPERRVELTVTPDAVVYGDAHLLRIMMNNLLSNAWKFSEKREVTRIEFGVRRQNDERVYYIRDNGEGFDMKYSDKLFVPFQRLHTEEEFPGTGIGLALVQRILRRHGGSIWAESAVDQGATFYFTLEEGEK